MIRRIVALALFALASTTAFAANPQVEFDTSQGKIRVELYPDAAPKTVANFLQYVKDGFYTGTQFHRVIPGFMVQGGGYGADYKEKPTRAPVPIESEQTVKAGLSNGIGTLAMARTGD
ncbi:MAG: peptidylprolyl isomerase, partial [Casimicrobiaceae bacterium]